MAAAGGHVEPPGRSIQREARRPDHASEPRGVRLPPPRAALPVERRERSSGMSQREAQVDVVDQQQLTPTHGPDALEGTNRVAQVEQQAPDVHEVELARLGRIEVVDAPLLEANAGAQRRVRDVEPATLLLAPSDRGDRVL